MERGHALDLGRRTRTDARENPLAAWLRRPRRRREADALLRASDGRWEDHPAVAWRVAELTSSRERRMVAGTLHSIVGQVRDPRARLSASVLARRRLRDRVVELKLLADRLADLDRPVSGTGIVLVRDLLTEGSSPLYIGGEVAGLVPALDHIHDLLEVR
jgi:hypothetical protein